MTTTIDPTDLDPRPTADGSGAPAERAGTGHRGRSRWPLVGAGAGAAAFVATLAGMSNDLTEEEWTIGVDVIDSLDRGGYHVAFVLGLVSVGLLLVASSGWRRWAERHAPDSLAARTIPTALGATAAINVIGYSLMGSMALYLPGGTDEGTLSREAVFVNFTFLDFGVLLGWWGGMVAAACVVALSLGRARALPRWMGVVSILLMLPPFLMGVIMALPGMPGFTMPIWLVVISLGMAFSRKVEA